MQKIHTKQTLPLDPESQWRLRRVAFGLGATLPVDEASNEALRAMRDEVLAEIEAELCC